MRETSEKQAAIKNIVKKPNIKYIVKTALDQILINFLDTAVSLGLLLNKDVPKDIDYLILTLFKLTNYSHVCKYLIDVANDQLQERAKLAQEKRQKKNLTEDDSIKNKDGNLGS